MIATNADSLIAEAFTKGVTGFDRQLAYEAVYKVNEAGSSSPTSDTHLYPTFSLLSLRMLQCHRTTIPPFLTMTDRRGHPLKLELG
jgi:hypothetical protein